jgi:zinc D-Ala-D-Ala carboxypeptidase
MENISKHITYAEATKSQIAVRNKIDNTPNDEELANMKLVAENCFEPLREWYKKAIGISSFFRNKKVNQLAGGSNSSDHPKGCSIDIDADIFNNGITNAQIFNWLKDNVEFDQLIWEYGDDKNPAWVHISFRKSGNRKQILYIKK